MIIHKNGDVFTSEMPAIGHGVNCKGYMGSGFAAAVRKRCPDVYKAYKAVCNEAPFGLQGGEMLPLYSDIENLWILNIASQVKEGRNAKYDLLEQGTEEAFVWCQENNVPGFAIVRIGSGIGGLNIDVVEDILDKIAAKYPDIDMELWTQ